MALMLISGGPRDWEEWISNAGLYRSPSLGLVRGISRYIIDILRRPFLNYQLLPPFTT